MGKEELIVNAVIVAYTGRQVHFILATKAQGPVVTTVAGDEDCFTSWITLTVGVRHRLAEVARRGNLVWVAKLVGDLGVISFDRSGTE